MKHKLNIAPLWVIALLGYLLFPLTGSGGYVGIAFTIAAILQQIDMNSQNRKSKTENSTEPEMMFPSKYNLGGENKMVSNSFLPELYDYHYNKPFLMNHESPETAIARKAPLEAIKLLDRISLRRHDEEINASGERIANNYLNRASEKILDELHSIDVIPRREWFKSHATGVTVKFNKRKT